LGTDAGGSKLEGMVEAVSHILARNAETLCVAFGSALFTLKSNCNQELQKLDAPFNKTKFLIIP